MITGDSEVVEALNLFFIVRMRALAYKFVLSSDVLCHGTVARVSDPQSGEPGFE